MAKKKETLLPRDNDQWKELCAWVELNIFEYEPTQKLQYKACVTLEGLRKGQITANNKQNTYGEYPINVILLTFKANKNVLLSALKGKNFESEDKKMRYCCAIIRDKLNDVYTRYLNAQKSQEKVERVDTSIMDYQGAEYQSSAKTIQDKKIDKFSDLW
jgi:hypothetical protein